MHHDDPLQELLDAVEEHIASLNSGVLVSSLWRRVEEALAPFRPDPEEELIEAMAQATRDPWELSQKWTDIQEDARETYLQGARAALAVIKEKGYFNDQR